MTARIVFALLSELPRLRAEGKSSDVTHIIPDDGEWSEQQITDHINSVMLAIPERDDVEEVSR